MNYHESMVGFVSSQFVFGVLLVMCRMRRSVFLGGYSLFYIKFEPDRRELHHYDMGHDISDFTLQSYSSKAAPWLFYSRMIYNRTDFLL